VAPVGPRKPAERAALGVQPSLGHQQARPPSTVDEPQAQTCAAFPFAGGDTAAARGFARRWRGDRQPEAVLIPTALSTDLCPGSFGD
jgi:hypothetical protein